jgi:hypothetical protein
MGTSFYDPNDKRCTGVQRMGGGGGRGRGTTFVHRKLKFQRPEIPRHYSLPGDLAAVVPALCAAGGNDAG